MPYARHEFKVTRCACPGRSSGLSLAMYMQHEPARRERRRRVLPAALARRQHHLTRPRNGATHGHATDASASSSARKQIPFTTNTPAGLSTRAARRGRGALTEDDGERPRAVAHEQARQALVPPVGRAADRQHEQEQVEQDRREPVRRQHRRAGGRARRLPDADDREGRVRDDAPRVEGHAAEREACRGSDRRVLEEEEEGEARARAARGAAERED
jgi:hypothetical protein